jgi:hypothetical protein
MIVMTSHVSMTSLVSMTSAGLLLVTLLSCGEAQLFGENMYPESKMEGPLADKVMTIDADLMEDIEMAESQQTEHQIKLRDFYR